MIKIKDVNKFRNEIIKQGYTFNAFSKKINTNRFTLNNIFRRERISPEKAKKSIDVLSIEFDDFFLIVECAKEHELSYQSKPTAVLIGNQELDPAEAESIVEYAKSQFPERFKTE